MSELRPVVLSIAGLDPSGGAGLLADIKTVEAHKVYGLGVVSANTVQNDITFEKAEWMKLEMMTEQIELLRKRFQIKFVKIGLIENMKILDQLISNLKVQIPDSKITWDPVLKASAGFEFHKNIDQVNLEKICSAIYLITPNIHEGIALGKTENAMENAKALSKFCNVFLKGGHREIKKGYDHLFTVEGKEFSFRPKLKNVSEKHGSGCVLSSAITANLAKGFSLHQSCLRGKEYTARFLASNTTLSGYHKI
jgi:hydroxymethylpyrimidine/phosphomethylpyrimidine kinase